MMLQSYGERGRSQHAVIPQKQHLWSIQQYDNSCRS